MEQYLYVDSNTHKGIPNNILSNANIQPKIVYDSRIDPDVKCPYCGRQLWEKGKKKMVYLRCPYCLKILS